MSIIDEQIAAGMGRGLTLGTFSSGVAGGGAAFILDIDQPALAVGVPAGTVIRPFSIGVQVQTDALEDAEETEALVAVDSLGLWKGDGTFTDETPSNLRTDLDKGSACRVGSVFTADMTTTPGFAVIADNDPVLDMELARVVMENDEGSTINNTPVTMSILYEPDFVPFLVGPCTLLIYAGGTGDIVGVFAQVLWVEGPEHIMIPAI